MDPLSANGNRVKVAQFVKNHADTYPYISPEKLDLSGKSVFIAGASKGIGRETALSYAKAGCSKIAIGARSDLTSLVEEVKKAGSKGEPQVLSLKIDVTSEENVKAAADEVAKAFGGSLDVLICNAGYLEEWLPIVDSKPAEWWTTFEINVKGTYLLNKFFIPLLLKSDIKTTILTSSYGGVSLRAGASAYQSTKFVVCRLAEFIEAEYGDAGITCYAIHPGGVKTELAHNMPKDMHAILTDEPALPADTIVWLTKESRTWLNGRFISVTWDMEELLTKKDTVVKGNLFKFRLLTE